MGGGGGSVVLVEKTVVVHVHPKYNGLCIKGLVSSLNLLVARGIFKLFLPMRMFFNRSVVHFFV